MSLKDIEKLKERVDKDPNSKLFVPLAEEYRKEGMLDEAISALMSGIERQPGYMSARVSLGKIFLEKGMTDEARGEFENVIKSIPDNLYAHKKLAEIYRDMGRKDLSMKSYRTVLKLNPLDDDALSNLRDLENEDLQGSGEAPAEVPEEALDAEAAEPAEEAVVEEEIAAEPEEIPAPIDVDDLNAFKDSIFGDKTVGEDVDIVRDAVDETAEPEEVSVPYEADVTEEVSVAEETAELEEVPVPYEADETEEESLEVVEEPLEEEVFEVAEELPEMETEMSFADVGDALEETAVPAADEAEEELSFADEESGAAAPVTTSAETPDEQSKLADADRFVAEGDYVRAIQTYREILSADPDNRMIMQRVEELRTLLKLMGKDKDALIVRLNAFLDGITKRRNEFYGRS